MEKSIFQALAQSALNEREQKSLSGGTMRKITILIPDFVTQKCPFCN